MLKPLIEDRDFTLHVGDAVRVLGTLPDASVDCVVTSPPYWGLRDYGTGTWEGGDAACDHTRSAGGTEKTTLHEHGAGQTKAAKARGLEARGAGAAAGTYFATCGRCGAVRVDEQIGLEQNPDCLGWATGEECGECFVCSLVAVFREVRRVLAAHGTCWVNLGDSYASKARGSDLGWAKSRLTNPASQQKRQAAALRKDGQRHRGQEAGLKEKDLAGIPWRVALALQADGWWLRSDVVWSKPNVMPESTTDRPTKAHEYVFLLAKQARYYFDADAVRDPHKQPLAIASWEERRAAGGGRGNVAFNGAVGAGTQVGVHGDDTSHDLGHPLGRNVRSVWEITTQPNKAPHFATFPPRLVERCIASGSPEFVCTVCGEPRRRIVEKGEPVLQEGTWSATGAAQFDAAGGGYEDAAESSTLKHVVPHITVGWTDCGHGSFRRGVVIDPFIGSGTTAVVARQLGRHCVGIELSPQYAAIAAERTQQLSVLAEDAA